jgi:hypothetical protein
MGRLSPSLMRAAFLKSELDHPRFFAWPRAAVPAKPGELYCEPEVVKVS